MPTEAGGCSKDRDRFSAGEVQRKAEARGDLPGQGPL